MLSTRFRGLCTASVTAISVGLFAAPAFAQDAPAAGGCASLPDGAQRDGCATARLQLASASVQPAAQPTDAQPTPDQPASAQPTADQGNAIVVTGSRIRRPNLESAVPITSVGPQELTERGEISLGDALNQLPSLRATFSQANSTAFIGTAGINQLDLRGQGPSRTLVLINGRRQVSVIPGSYIVDVNTIPSDLIERVDIVTGGNSAIYGSDAIAGVVNFVLRRDFDGFRIRGQGGISTYGDRGNYEINALAGHNFLDGRLNVTLALGYARAEAVFFADRPYLGALNGNGHGGTPGFITSEITTAPNRNFDGIPNTVFQDGNPGITFGNVSLGGYVATVCPAATATNAARVAAVCTGRLSPTGGRIPYNFAFMPDGTLARDDEAHGLVDNRAIGGGVLGGLSATGLEGAMLDPGLEQYSANLLMHGDFSPAFRPFLEAKYVRVTATQENTQPTFLSGSPLIATFSINNPFLTQQARDTLNLITGGAQTFNMIRFNYDIGDRAENHLRQTYRVVVGSEGDISQRGNLHYEVSFNYGRTTTYYATEFNGVPGNVNVAHFNNALNAVRNAAGQIVCAINADANPNNDDPACVPFNPFGFGAPSQAAKDYVSYVSTRNQWAEEIDAIGFISGDSTGFFNLPGGPVGFAVGAEYRREDAYSAYDPFTASGGTFLNAFAPFAPPAVSIKEGFGELRLPLLRDLPFMQELSLEGAARYSDYGGATGGVWAYNAGGIWAPIRDIRFRATYSRSVRAPNLSNLYATPGVGFANNLTDPCDQPGANANATNNITAGPNRRANCAAAGVPTTLTYVDGSGATVTVPWSNTPGSGVQGINQGNPNLVPEVGQSLTFGAVLQPRFLPGFSLSVDYYRIKITNVIAGLSGQAIINQCYDDPGGINNPYCAAVFRRTSANPLENATFNGQVDRQVQNLPNQVFPLLGPAYLNQPFNFVAQKTSGIDLDMNYRTHLNSNIVLSLRAIVSWVQNREQFTSISAPTVSTRILGLLGDPEWLGAFSANVDFGEFDFTYNARYVGRQIVSGLSWETFFPWQGRQPSNPDARPFAWYAPVVYQNIRLNFEPRDSHYRFYVGVDNITNQLPPYELTGTENPSSGVSGAVYPNTGRFFYAGAEFRF